MTDHVCVVNDVIVMHVTVNDVIVSCCWGMTLTMQCLLHPQFSKSAGPVDHTRWQETSVIDRASRFEELRVKEALHIHLTPEDQRFNRDVGLELLGCWVSTLKTLCVKPRPPPLV